MPHSPAKPFTLLSLPVVKNTREVVSRFPFPIALTRGGYRKLVITLNRDGAQIFHDHKDIRDFDFVWLSSGWRQRDLAYATHLYLESTGTPHAFVEQGTSKVTDCMAFALHHLPIPDTVFLSPSFIPENLDVIESVCGYPLIIKDIRGAQGKHSRLVHSGAELIEVMRSLPPYKKFLFQRYIPNDYDWGVMVVNGEVVSGEKSYAASGQFLNNAAAGAREEFAEVSAIPDNIKKMAVKASEILGLSWSRVDIMIDKDTGKAYILEVNRYPGLTTGSTEILGAYAFLASHILPRKE